MLRLEAFEELKEEVNRGLSKDIELEDVDSTNILKGTMRDFLVYSSETLFVVTEVMIRHGTLREVKRMRVVYAVFLSVFKSRTRFRYFIHLLRLSFLKEEDVITTFSSQNMTFRRRSSILVKMPRWDSRLPGSMDNT